MASLPRYSTRYLLIVTTISAVACAAGVAISGLPTSTLPKWLAWGLTPPLCLPGLAAQAVLLWIVSLRPRYTLHLLLRTVAASLATWIVMLSPGLHAWYTWEIVGDHTANIGAGMLALGQVVLAPVATLLTWSFTMPWIRLDRVGENETGDSNRA